MKSRWFSLSSLLATGFVMAAMLETSLGAPLRENVMNEPRGEYFSRDFGPFAK